ncbi:uncharacterized protein LOC104886264 [Beta vulgaris subsp. vulgaris]|uniref:uncharacterized protein LOC104886264 n=1 Tax=Beta vulgaris subsp. vulgaris TaxID=3555 RepID=UPI0005401667|nr:uncharacterized protein LOC104886264 [Beta vulgaris subsp. vulgaris]
MPSSDQSIHADGSDLVIAAIYGELHFLALARPSDQAWVTIDTDIASIVCLKDLILILKLDYSLRYCDIKQIEDFEAVKVMQYLPPPPMDGFFRNKFIDYDNSYLVELGGDLVMVIRHKTLIHDLHLDGYVYVRDYYTECFEVFRLNYKSKKWVEVKDLGNFIIFLGLGCNIAIPTSSSTNWKRNYILQMFALLYSMCLSFLYLIASLCYHTFYHERDYVLK